MPGCGKSSVGVLLAKLAGLRFVDTDLNIQQLEGATLQEVLEARGYQYLREAEQRVLLDVALADAVIATGGSAVYSNAAMARLSHAGPVVYLRAPLQVLRERVEAAPPRGIASDPQQSYAQVYAERTPLYERCADVTVDSEGATPEQLAVRILDTVLS
jgi:shikimate kinase